MKLAATGIPPQEPSSARSGIALVITLGILASLTIMAIGFATFMRTERLAAASYVDIVDTRHLALAALDTAIYDVAKDAGNDLAIPYLWETSENLSPPTTLTTNKADRILFGRVQQEEGGTVHFLSAEVTNAIGNALEVPWSLMMNDDGDLVAAYAFLVVNESDRLDINYMPSNYNAGTRSSVSNLYMVGLNNINATAMLGRVYGMLHQYERQYNQAELKYAVKSNFVGGTGLHPNDDHFTAYSKFSQLYDNGAGIVSRVNLDQSEDELKEDETKSDIIAALQFAGVPGNVADLTYNNIIDYVDPDYLPIGGDLSYNGEPIPMINEIVLTNNIDFDGVNTYEHEMSVSVELWYPFVGVTNDRTYELLIAAQVAGSQPVGAFDRNFVTAPPIIVSGGPPWTDNLIEVVTVKLPNATYEDPGGAPANPANMEANVAVRLSEQNQPNPVDSAGFSGGAAGLIQFDASAFSIDEEVIKSKSVNDPRINWRKSDWVDAAETPGALNQNPPYDPGNDGVLYVRNGLIRNVGELGYIGLGDASQPWRSLRLVDSSAERVLDVFTMHAEPYVHGLVNVNSTTNQVLATALYNARVERFSDAADANVLDWTKAMDAADDIIKFPFKPSAGYSKSQLGLVSTLSDGSLFAQNNENEQESIIRTIADMMDVSGQTFTVVLQVLNIKQDATSLTDDSPNGEFDGDEIDAVAGEEHLVAQFWRDPISKEIQLTFLKWVAPGGI